MLLQSLGLEGKKQLSHHQHNYKERIPDVLRRVTAGASCAIVTDAGTPGKEEV